MIKPVTTIKKRHIKEKLLCVGSAAAFIALGIYGVVMLFAPDYFSHSQAILVITESLLGMVISISPMLVYKLFKIRLSFIFQLIFTAFLILAIIFGEGLLFYYKVNGWDKMLHFVSGFGISYIGCCLVYSTLKNSNLSNRRKLAFCITGAIMISLTVAIMWEIIEFSIDSVFGTNMQKFMPENNPFFNGGNSKVDLEGTPQDFYDFFRHPDGYKYALMDTMMDIVYALAGTFMFVILWIFTKNTRIYGSVLYREKGEQHLKVVNVNDIGEAGTVPCHDAAWNEDMHEDIITTDTEVKLNHLK